MNDKAIADILDDIARLSVEHGPSLIINAIYGDLCPQNSSGEPAGVKLADIVKMKKIMSDLSALVPKTNNGCLDICNSLKASDIQRVCVFSAALKFAKLTTVWLHHSLAVALNRLALGGTTEARAPCLLHSLLAIACNEPNREPEPMPRAILARELKTFSPRDAIQQGLEAMSLGFALPYNDVINAAQKLAISPPVTAPSLDLIELRQIAAACHLPPLRGPKVVRSQAAEHVTECPATETETRILTAPKGDAHYYIFRSAGMPITLPRISVYNVACGTISFDITSRGRPQFYVFDGSGSCISELSFGLTPFIDDDCPFVDSDLALLSDRYSGTMNICHFLLDQFTRISLYHDKGDMELSYLIADDHDYYRSIMSLAGFGEHIVFPRSKKFSIRAKNVLISSNIKEDFKHPGHLCADWALDFLRTQLIGHSSLPGSRRIYISRADAASRNITNREEVETFLAKRGYEIVVLSALSASEQIETFRAASHVVGVHGAGLTNLAFSSPGTHVVEIFSPFAATGAYWTLSSQLRHHYYALVADDPELAQPNYLTWTHRPELNDRNVFVPIQKLADAIGSFDV